MKHQKLIAIFFAILISSMTCGFSSNSPKSRTSGNATCFITNPPNATKTWQFFGENTISVSISNISHYTSIATLKCTSVDDLGFTFTLYPNDYITNLSYGSFYMSYPVPWTFDIVLSNYAQIQVSAEWH